LEEKNKSQCELPKNFMVLETFLFAEHEDDFDWTTRRNKKIPKAKNPVEHLGVAFLSSTSRYFSLLLCHGD
jgi:hypothetical protein